MRYTVLEQPLAAVNMHGRKRPRHEELDHHTLPPLHAYHSHGLGHGLHHSMNHLPSPYEVQRPVLLPTLSQMLRPSVQFPPVQPPAPRSLFLHHNAPSAQHSSPSYSFAPTVIHSRQTSPSPPPSEVSMDDEEEAEDKTPWPTANEYYDLLSDESRKASIPVYDLGVDPRGVPLQPEFIYNEPRSCMYFLKCGQLLGRGSFGFPRKKKTTVTTKNAKGGIESVRRCDASKEFEWRKMSFVTGLPKKQPIVRYITATCYSKTHRSSTEKKKVMRMHAVMLANEEGAGECGDYVLVHIRAGGSKRVGVRTNNAAHTPSSSSPVSSPARTALTDSSTASPSIQSLLAAHSQVMMMTSTARPATPLMYNNYPSTSNSASPLNKRRRSDMLPSLGTTCPRQMPLWLSPPQPAGHM